MRLTSLRGFAAIGLIILGGSTAAMAADVMPPLPPMPPVVYTPPPANIWTGAYVGIGGVWSAGHINYDAIDPPIQGGEAGMFAGFNYQIGHVVLGIDVGAYRSWETGTNYSEYWDSGNKFSVTTTAALGWAGNLSARAGVVLGREQRLMVYATGGLGWAIGHAEMTNIGSFGNATWLADQSSATFAAFGPMLGVGVELALTPHVSLRLEGNYTWYPSVHVIQDYQMYDNTTTITIPGDARVMAGVVWHFGG